MRNRGRLLCLLLLLSLTTFACERTKPAPVVLPTAIELGVGAPVAISQDGRSLLVIRAEPELNVGWLQPVDGSPGRKVFEFTAASFSAAFSPDGRYLAWSADGLWIANADGSGMRRLLDDETVGAIAWSPAADQLAVALGDRISRVDLSGKRVGDVLQAESVRAIAWVKQSAGERIFLASFPADQPPFVATVLPTGQGFVQIAVAEAFALVGDRILVAEPFSAGPLRLLDSITGANPMVVIENGVQSAAASPASNPQVAYVLQGTDDVNGNLWLCGLDGQNRRQLTDGPPVLGPLWSPDGKRLYFASFNPNAGEQDDPFLTRAFDIR